MDRSNDGRIGYQLVFLNAPELEDQILVERPYEIGDRIDLHDRPQSFFDSWEVGDLWKSADGKPDILVMARPPARGD